MSEDAIVKGDAIEKWIEDQIERIDWTDPEGEPGKRGCRMCRGEGTVPGDRVPYGSTTVSMPDTICDCVFDKFYCQAERGLESGEYKIVGGRLIEA